MSERLLTARELAGLLAASTETLLRWTRRGELPTIRLPRSPTHAGKPRASLATSAGAATVAE